MIRRTLLAACAALGLAAATAEAQAQNLRIGLREDPDILDPTLARTFVGRIVCSSPSAPMCASTTGT
jgi:peptide/nickel transport system substrate-binding protein